MPDDQLQQQNFKAADILRSEIDALKKLVADLVNRVTALESKLP